MYTIEQAMQQSPDTKDLFEFKISTITDYFDSVKHDAAILKT